MITGSMYPEIEAGEKVIIKKCKTYNVGDIVTYINNDESFITHRIISIQDNLYYTKGDYNNVQDIEPVTIEQIYGKVIFHYKPLIPSTLFSFAKYVNSTKVKVSSKTANPIFIVNGDNEINITKYGSINNYEFSVKNYSSTKISDVDLNYTIEVIADDIVSYQVFSNNTQIDLSQTFELSHTSALEHNYILTIEAPEDYNGTVKVNVYAYQKEV